MAEHFLSVSDVARLIGVHTSNASEYKLPDPDAWIGHTRGWRKETIERWNADRPGHGGNPNWIKR